MVKAKAKKSAEERTLATIKPYLPHIVFSLFGAYLALSGIGMIEDEIRTQLLFEHDKSNKIWGYGMIIFGSMLVSGALAQAAQINARRKGGNA